MPPSPSTPIKIHTYHCLCTTHLLTTPYALSSLPRRAAPALDKAFILPLGTSSPLSSSSPNLATNYPHISNTTITTDEVMADDEEGGKEGEKGEGGEEVKKGDKIMPSLLSSALRAARKVIVVRREDGFEKRRVWRCGRCGVGVGYEVVGGAGGEREERGNGDGDGERGRVMFLLEGGLREGDEM